MHGCATIDASARTLRRIAALLLALAGLAERVAAGPPALRRLVLWLLRPGAAVAADWLAGQAHGPAARPAPWGGQPDDDSPAGALRLAARLRALAAAVAWLAAALGGQPPARAWPALRGERAGRRLPAAAVGRRDSS